MRVAIVNIGTIVSGDLDEPFARGDTIITEGDRIASASDVAVSLIFFRSKYRQLANEVSVEAPPDAERSCKDGNFGLRHDGRVVASDHLHQRVAGTGAHGRRRLIDRPARQRTYLPERPHSRYYSAVIYPRSLLHGRTS